MCNLKVATLAAASCFDHKVRLIHILENSL